METQIPKSLEYRKVALREKFIAITAYIKK
jgi:hypothetical protein